MISGTDAAGDPAPLFIAKDLVEAVGAVWEGAKTIAHIPEGYKLVLSIHTSFGDKDTQLLTEAGMNMYLFRSDYSRGIRGANQSPPGGRIG